ILQRRQHNSVAAEFFIAAARRVVLPRVPFGGIRGAVGLTIWMPLGTCHRAGGFVVAFHNIYLSLVVASSGFTHIQAVLVAAFSAFNSLSRLDGCFGDCSDSSPRRLAATASRSISAALLPGCLSIVSQAR